MTSREQEDSRKIVAARPPEWCWWRPSNTRRAARQVNSNIQHLRADRAYYQVDEYAEMKKVWCISRNKLSRLRRSLHVDARLVANVVVSLFEWIHSNDEP